MLKELYQLCHQPYKKTFSVKTVYLVDELDEITKENKVDYTVVYGKIMYQASSWPY